MQDYYLSKTLDATFEETVARVIEGLKAEGFGILTEIDVQETLKRKLNVDFRRYTILGACNPPVAYQALQAERNIGLMLPCNVIVQEASVGKTEVAAVNPLILMQAVGIDRLSELAAQVAEKLKRAIERL